MLISVNPKESKKEKQEAAGQVEHKIRLWILNQRSRREEKLKEMKKILSTVFRKKLGKPWRENEQTKDRK